MIRPGSVLCGKAWNETPEVVSIEGHPGTQHCERVSRGRLVIVWKLVFFSDVSTRFAVFFRGFKEILNFKSFDHLSNLFLGKLAM